MLDEELCEVIMEAVGVHLWRFRLSSCVYRLQRPEEVLHRDVFNKQDEVKQDRGASNLGGHREDTVQWVICCILVSEGRKGNRAWTRSSKPMQCCALP